jgi:uncharacterized protein
MGDGIVHMLRQWQTPVTSWTKLGRHVSKAISNWITVDEARVFQVVTHKAVIPNLPEAFESLKIVQLSDIHYYEFSCPEYHQEIIDAVNALQPDIIVTTGDTIHYGEHYLDMAHHYLSQLQASVGKWACLGNHDYNDNYRSYGVRAVKQESGFEMLVNEATVIKKEGQQLWLSGIDDYILGQPDHLTAFHSVEKNAAHIALAHNPKLGPILTQHQQAPHLILAGHTHGGQIKHPVADWVHHHVLKQHYQYGWYELAEESQMYVTSGVGSANLSVHLPHFDFALHPFRIGTTPEIAVYELTGQPLNAEASKQEKSQIYAGALRD